jgi:hypothetical protein
LLGALALSACGPGQARHTVEEYRADAELRHAQVGRCRKDPGTLRNTPDCINAEAAAALEDRTRLRDAAPIGLESDKNPTKPADEREEERE